MASTPDGAASAAPNPQHKRAAGRAILQNGASCRRRSHQYRKSDCACLDVSCPFFKTARRYLASSLQATGAEAFPGAFVLPSAVPIILVALLFFVLLSLGSLVLLSFALRYRAGAARRQGRRWFARSECLDDHLLGRFFLLSFTFLVSFWIEFSLSICAR